MNYLVTGTAYYRARDPKVFTLVLHSCRTLPEATHRSEMHVRVVGGREEVVEHWSVTSAMPFEQGEDVAVGHEPDTFAGSALPRGYGLYARNRES